MYGGVVCVTQAYFNGDLQERTRLKTPTALCSLFVEVVRKALLSSHCSWPSQLAGWLFGQRDKRDLASSRLLYPSVGPPAETISSGAASVCWGYPENDLRVPVTTAERC